LGQWFAARTHEQARPFVRSGIDCGSENIGLQDHPWSTACGMIVDGAMLVGCRGSDIAGIELPSSLLQRAARQRMAEWPREHLGEEREDGGAEGHCG
jgi:hypothetical protein